MRVNVSFCWQPNLEIPKKLYLYLNVIAKSIHFCNLQQQKCITFCATLTIYCFCILVWGFNVTNKRFENNKAKSFQFKIVWMKCFDNDAIDFYCAQKDLDKTGTQRRFAYFDAQGHKREGIIVEQSTIKSSLRSLWPSICFDNCQLEDLTCGSKR